MALQGYGMVSCVWNGIRLRRQVDAVLFGD